MKFHKIPRQNEVLQDSRERNEVLQDPKTKLCFARFDKNYIIKKKNKKIHLINLLNEFLKQKNYKSSKSC